jgi:hypothetical protein
MKLARRMRIYGPNREGAYIWGIRSKDASKVGIYRTETTILAEHCFSI